MVYHNNENGASLQKLTDKSQISGKPKWILLSEIGKKESKTLNTPKKLLKEPSVQSEHEEPEMLMRKPTKN